MDDDSDAWVALLSAGSALSVVGLLLLDSTPWFVQFSVLGLAFVLTVYAAYHAVEESAEV